MAVSNWLRPDASTSDDRLFCHVCGRGDRNTDQFVPGWPYSFVAALESGRTSWVAMLDAVRLGPADDATLVTAVQLRPFAVPGSDPPSPPPHSRPRPQGVSQHPRDGSRTKTVPARPRQKDDPKKSPAITALEEVLYEGRAARINVLYNGRAAVGGLAPAAREQFATVIPARAPGSSSP